MKECTKCKTKKGLLDFHKDRRRPDGLRGWCKTCDAEQDRTYAHSHKEEIAEKQRTPEGKAAHCRKNWKYRKDNPEKIKAHSAVQYAIAAGKLERSIFCEECGLPAKTQGHHEDYSQPLDVDWLCTKCHTELHSILA